MEAEPIPFARPFFGREEEEAAIRVLRSGWLTTGKETLAFEGEFADFLAGAAVSAAAGPPAVPLEKPFCLAVNSATSGLHLALAASGVGHGDLVLVPSYTFVSTAETALYLGAEPVFVDVAPGSFHMDTGALEETLTRLASGLPAYRRRGKDFGPRGKAAAVIPVHFGGLPCPMTVLETARRFGAAVIEDAAHAFPSRVEGGCAGTFGDMGVFSFYATKTITTGEGGMVVCRNGETAEHIRALRSHGIDRAVWNRYTDTKAPWYYEVTEQGYKYNLPDILGAVGRVQLSRAETLLAMREATARRYDQAFGNEEALTIPPTGQGDARHLYPLRLDTGKLSVSRDVFIEKLQERGIGASVHFIPLHSMPYYRERQNLEEGDFPRTMESYRREISLPLWPGMTEAMTERVIRMVKALIREYNK
ncbi:MAG: DegT/DnrJ/EryC1/StrS family aminotransferase [Treponema sp.]|jgi:dTDP-4-amino-4,6-dideoxygalactose transaminase|nr:DegT/DnrJ/EryC1/StrS family aminotransferase [Treponema sp.]